MQFPYFMCCLQLFALGQPSQPQLQPEPPFCFMCSRASTMAATSARMITISQIFISLPYPAPSAMPISRTSTAASQASEHCQSTTPMAQPWPSSRLMAAIAATHGV